MKKIILVLIVAAAAYFAYKTRVERLQQEANPAVIERPVYAETKVDLKGEGGRVINSVVLVATASQVECDTAAAKMVQTVLDASARKGVAGTVKSIECKRELDARMSRVFANQPTFVTYMVLGRGKPEERETRMLYWGVTVEESDLLCEMVPHIQKGWAGKVSCVRASR
jgi:imidazole glycerol phosphate synthase subunit HisF